MRLHESNPEGRLKLEDYSIKQLREAVDGCFMYAAAMVDLGYNPHVSQRLKEIEDELDRRKRNETPRRPSYCPSH